MQLLDRPLPARHATGAGRPLVWLGFTSRDGVPTDRAAFWVPLLGGALTGGGVALWLFS